MIFVGKSLGTVVDVVYFFVHKLCSYFNILQARSFEGGEQRVYRIHNDNSLKVSNLMGIVER